MWVDFNMFVGARIMVSSTELDWDSLLRHACLCVVTSQRCLSLSVPGVTVRTPCAPDLHTQVTFPHVGGVYQSGHSVMANSWVGDPV